MSGSLLTSFLLAPSDDQLVRRLLGLARTVAQGRLAPRGLRVAARSGLALASAVRMVPGVHRRAAHSRPDAEPAAASGLAARLVLVLDVTDLADRGLAVDVDAAQFSRRHADHGVVAFLRKQLGRRSGAAHQLAAAAERELDVVDRRTDRDVRQRDGVADPHRRVDPTLDRVPHLQAQRRQDVALLTVLVVDQRDPGAAVGVVLDRRDLARHAVLVALEVDLAVELAIAAALVPRRDPALVVAAGVRRDRLHERLLGRVGRDLLEPGDRHEPAARAGRLELSNRHLYTLPNRPSIF